MPLLDRFGRPTPQPERHVRSCGFHGGSRPISPAEHEAVTLVIPPQPADPPQPDHLPPAGV